MNWYKKSQLNDNVIFYHVTTEKNALKILQDGFIPPKNLSRIWFTQKPLFWLNQLKSEKFKYDKVVVLEVTIPKKLYEEEFYEWGKNDPSPYFSQFSYGEGKSGWKNPIYDRPILKNNFNCSIRIMSEDELV